MIKLIQFETTRIHLLLDYKIFRDYDLIEVTMETFLYWEEIKLCLITRRTRPQLKTSPTFIRIESLIKWIILRESDCK